MQAIRRAGLPIGILALAWAAQPANAAWRNVDAIEHVETRADAVGLTTASGAKVRAFTRRVRIALPGEAVKLVLLSR
jgi:hypothetical protein